MDDERQVESSGRYIAPTGEELGVRPTPYPGVEAPTYWYPRRRGAAWAYQRRWLLAAVAFVVVVLVVVPLAVSLL